MESVIESPLTNKTPEQYFIELEHGSIINLACIECIVPSDYENDHPATYKIYTQHRGEYKIKYNDFNKHIRPLLNIVFSFRNK